MKPHLLERGLDKNKEFLGLSEGFKIAFVDDSKVLLNFYYSKKNYESL
jgi:hypothetical protein